MKALFLSLVSVFYAHAAFASCGTFEVSKGDVKVKPASGKEVDATVGAKICAGDAVIAGDSARAKIKMEDGNELNISPNSKIVIETYQYDVAANKKKVLLNVLRGKVRATTREENMYTDKAKDGQANTFQIRTKSAVAGVRGTDFLTTFDPKSQKMEVVTFRGKVEVGQLGSGGKIVNSVFVAVGQKTEVIGGQAPAVPKALPASELMKQNNESRNEGSTQGASAPVRQDDKKDDKKQDDRKQADGGKQGEGGKSGDDGKRAPASSTGTMGGTAPTSGSMISTNDLPSATGGTDLPKLALPPLPPPLPTTILNSNILINNAIQKQNANVTINLSIK